MSQHHHHAHVAGEEVGADRIAELLAPPGRKVLVTTHRKPDGDAAGFVQGETSDLFFTQMFHQDRCAPVDEALGQLFMQRIGQAVFDGAGFALPVRAIAGPAGAARRIGKGSDLRQSSRQSGDIAFGDIQPGDLPRHPIVGNAARHQEQIDRLDHTGVIFGR